MKSLSAILSLTTVLCAVIAAVVFFSSRNRLQDQEAATIAAQQALTAKQAELTVTAEKLDAAGESLRAERESLAAAKRNLESVRSEMLTARQELTRTSEELSRAGNEIAELNRTTSSLRSELVERERELAAASSTGAENQLKERIRELEAEIKRLGNELSNALRAKMSSPATGSTIAPAAAPVPSAIAGSSTVITSVSRDAGILLLAGGRELGLSPGMDVTLVSDLKAVARVRIGKVADTYTVANILPGTNTKGLYQGMTVSILR